MSEPATRTGSLLSETKGLLRQFDLKAKKSLGQHFLVNSAILKTITAAAEISPTDIVLEIGPGLGVLTWELVSLAGWVIAIELDSRLADILLKRTANASNVSVINRDILEIEPRDLIRQEKSKTTGSFFSSRMDLRRA